MSACGVPWPVCPSCPGARVWEGGGLVRCERCGREWPTSERVPCPDPATVGLTDAGGGGTVRLVCPSHAAHPSAGELRRALEPVRAANERPPACSRCLHAAFQHKAAEYGAPCLVPGCECLGGYCPRVEPCEARSSTGLRCDLERGHRGVHVAPGVEWLTGPRDRPDRERETLRAVQGGRGRCPACGGACERVEDLPLPPGAKVRAWSGPAFVCATCRKAWTAAEVGEEP